MTPAILMSSVFFICHSALACPHESGECGIQYFVCLWIPASAGMTKRSVDDSLISGWQANWEMNHNC